METANQLNLRLFVPALVFDAVTSNDFNLLAYPWLIAAGVIVVLGSGLIGWVVARVRNYQVPVFVPPMMFNNCGNMGLPVALLTFGEAGLQAALVLFLVSNFFHFTLGVRLVGGRMHILQVIFNPVNIATMAGLAVNFSGWTLPAPPALAIEMAGQIAIPLMLVALGVRMIDLNRSMMSAGLVGAIVRPLAGLLCAFAASLVLPLEPFHFQMLILFSVMPPAVLNYLFSERYQVQPDHVAAIVVVGNAISVVVLYFTLLFLLNS